MVIVLTCFRKGSTGSWWGTGICFNCGPLFGGGKPDGNPGGGGAANNGRSCLAGAGPLAVGQSRCPCFNSTLTAAGIDARQQIATAQTYIGWSRYFGYGDLIGYYNAVHTGGPNDIKDLPGHSRNNPVDVDAGNISFGITCPFGAGFCQFAAGFAQTMSGYPNFKGTLATGFDTPADNAGIRVGQAMRVAGCHE